jgi:hypothetical protein
VLSRFWVFFSDGSPKTLQKTFCKKNRVENFLQKVRPKTKNPKPIFSRNCFLTFLGVSRRGEIKNTIQKTAKKINPTLVLFRTLTHPPTTGVTDFFFGGPLKKAESRMQKAAHRRQPPVGARYRS